jgi:hypothetical protein
MTPEVLLDLARIQRRVMGLPEPLERLDAVLERMMCRDLTIEERRRYAKEYLTLTAFPERNAA